VRGRNGKLPRNKITGHTEETQTNLFKTLPGPTPILLPVGVMPPEPSFTEEQQRANNLTYAATFEAMAKDCIEASICLEGRQNALARRWSRAMRSFAYQLRASAMAPVPLQPILLDDPMDAADPDTRPAPVVTYPDDMNGEAEGETEGEDRSWHTKPWNDDPWYNDPWAKEPWNTPDLWDEPDPAVTPAAPQDGDDAANGDTPAPEEPEPWNAPHPWDDPGDTNGETPTNNGQDPPH
jgi:hypothetical protein